LDKFMSKEMTFEECVHSNAPKNNLLLQHN
jgi:hypothetical protein